MSSLLVLGAGGHGRVVADTALACQQYERIAFLDDRFDTLGTVLNLPVLGPISNAPSLQSDFSDAIVAVGDNRLRLRLLEALNAAGFSVASIVHPTAYIGTEVAIGDGTVIFSHSVVNTGTVVGKGVIINTGVTIDHDSQISDGVHLSPGVHLAGSVTVKDCTWIGTGAAIIPGIQIGMDVVVGAGTVVIRDIPDGVTVVGNPGRIIRKGCCDHD